MSETPKCAKRLFLLTLRALNESIVDASILWPLFGRQESVPQLVFRDIKGEK